MHVADLVEIKIGSTFIIASEGACLGQMGEDARRLVLARLVLENKVCPHDPLSMPDDDDAAVAALLSENSIDQDTAQKLAVS